MFLRSLITVIFLSSLLCFASSQDTNEVDDDGMTERKKKQERLRWFPADTEADCEEEPGAEQVSVRVTMMSCDVTLCIIR